MICIIPKHIFHKWTKWEQYSTRVNYTMGRLAPKSMQGKTIQVDELRQKRMCTKCGKIQDILVRKQ